MSAPGVDAAAVKAVLEADRKDISDRLAIMTKAPEKNSGISFGKRVGDGTIEAVSRLTEVGVADNLQAKVERIDRALEKLAAGDYGYCDVCGEEIPAKRLEFAPESVVCVKHAAGRR